jgi:hypothetical protein
MSRTMGDTLQPYVTTHLQNGHVLLRFVKLNSNFLRVFLSPFTYANLCDIRTTAYHHY